MPKYDDFELDIQKIEAKEVNYLITRESMHGLTCPECHPFSKYPGDCR